MQGVTIPMGVGDRQNRPLPQDLFAHKLHTWRRMMLWFFWSLACSSRCHLRRAHARCVIHSVFSIVMKQ